MHELHEEHVYETPDGRRYLAGTRPGLGWGLRPYPTIAADIAPPGDYEARLRAAAALLSTILWVEEGTGALRRFVLDHLEPDMYGPVHKAMAAAWRQAPTEAEGHWEDTGWSIDDLIHYGPRSE
jgi:hypothetical protein